MSRIERGIKKIHNKYMVSISYCKPGKTISTTKYVSMADNLENARKIRNQAEMARDCGEFEMWYEKFVVNGRKLFDDV